MIDDTDAEGVPDLLQLVAVVELTYLIVGMGNEEAESVALGYLAECLAVAAYGIKDFLPFSLQQGFLLDFIVKGTHQLPGIVMTLFAGLAID